MGGDASCPVKSLGVITPGLKTQPIHNATTPRVQHYATGLFPRQSAKAVQHNIAPCSWSPTVSTASSPSERDYSPVSGGFWSTRFFTYLPTITSLFTRFQIFPVSIRSSGFRREGGFPSARHCKFSQIQALFIIPFEIIYIFLLLLLLNAIALPICVKGLALSTGRAGIEGLRLPNEVSHPATIAR